MLFSVSHVPENKMPEPLEHALPFFIGGLTKNHPILLIFHGVERGTLWKMTIYI